MTSRQNSTRGFTLVETLIALAIGALLLAALMDVVTRTLLVKSAIENQRDVARDTRFALQRMVDAIEEAPRLLVPSPDIPGTGWSEHIREQTVPPSPPEPGSSWASAVLAVTLSRNSDLDGDGVADADNDRDGRIDEDWPNDIHLDFASGIAGIDDDGDGAIDEAHTYNDDEVGGINNEDWLNNLDDDADGSVDEDPPTDMNADGCPGLCLVDDDLDGSIDEGTASDDDEDGGEYEDWLDPVVFRLVGDTLVERTPVPWDTTGNGIVDGRDYVESTIARNVTHFRVERIPALGNGPVLLDLTLALTGDSMQETFSLSTRVRVGAAVAEYAL